MKQKNRKILAFFMSIIFIVTIFTFIGCQPATKKEDTTTTTIIQDYIGTWEGTNNNIFSTYIFQKNTLEIKTYQNNTKTNQIGGSRDNVTVNNNIMFLSITEIYDSLTKSWTNNNLPPSINVKYSITNNTINLIFDTNGDGIYDPVKETNITLTKVN